MDELNDVDDLEDRLEVLQGIVDQLKDFEMNNAELEIVRGDQALSQYVALEDSILHGIETLSGKIPEDQQGHLVKCTEKYNELGPDFQDTWPENYWNVYELVRGGYESVKFKQKVKNNEEISSKVAEVQDLALTLNRKDKKSGFLDEENEGTLKEVDELAKQYQNSTLESQDGTDENKKEKCCKCIVF